jgi:hypothetical protein
MGLNFRSGESCIEDVGGWGLVSSRSASHLEDYGLVSRGILVMCALSIGEEDASSSIHVTTPFFYDTRSCAFGLRGGHVAVEKGMGFVIYIH